MSPRAGIMPKRSYRLRMMPQNLEIKEIQHWLRSGMIGLLIAVLSLTGCGSTTGYFPITGPIPQTLTPPINPESQFSVQLRFVDDSLNQRQRDRFAEAATEWTYVIVGDLLDTFLFLNGGQCLPQIPTVNQVIDDVLVDVIALPIDGPGGILGLAGPCALRSGSNLPVYGVVQLDSDDLARLEVDRVLEAVALHEIGHVLGFGSLWQQRQLRAGSGSNDPRYTGRGANEAYAKLGGTGHVPLEIEGGLGSRDSHWRESVLGNELMTGSINSGVLNPLSTVTVRAMEDLNYTVNLEGAMDYRLPLPQYDETLRSYTPKFSQDIELHELPFPTPPLWVEPDGRLSSHPLRDP